MFQFSSARLGREAFRSSTLHTRETSPRFLRDPIAPESLYFPSFSAPRRLNLPLLKRWADLPALSLLRTSSTFQIRVDSVFLLIQLKGKGLFPNGQSHLCQRSALTGALLADSQVSAIELLFGIGQTATPDRVATTGNWVSSETSNDYPQRCRQCCAEGRPKCDDRIESNQCQLSERRSRERFHVK
jgi:hypothetical protein